MENDLVKTYIETLVSEGGKSPRLKKLPLNPESLTIGEAAYLANYCSKLMQTNTWKKIKEADAASNNK